MKLWGGQFCPQPAFQPASRPGCSNSEIAMKDKKPNSGELLRDTLDMLVLKTLTRGRHAWLRHRRVHRRNYRRRAAG